MPSVIIITNSNFLLFFFYEWTLSFLVCHSNRSHMILFISYDFSVHEHSKYIHIDISLRKFVFDFLFFIIKRIFRVRSILGIEWWALLTIYDENIMLMKNWNHRENDQFFLLQTKRVMLWNFKFDIHKLIKIEAIAKDVNEKKRVEKSPQFLFKWNLCVFSSQQIENLCFFSPFSIRFILFYKHDSYR